MAPREQGTQGVPFASVMENFILPGLVLLVYIAFIFPQLKKRRDTRDLLASLGEGDEVVMSSGLHGIITALDEHIVYVEVSDGVEMKFTRTAVTTKLKNDDIDGDT